jgi:Ca-activated chloride channel family protein
MKQENSSRWTLTVLIAFVMVIAVIGIVGFLYVNTTSLADTSSKACSSYPGQYSSNAQPDYGIKNSWDFVKTEDNPVSTFGADVDTGSYTIMRNSINNGLLPDSSQVRTEEFLNYFDYHYPAHTGDDFRVYTECGPSIFDADHHMLKIGIQGRSVPDEERKPTTLIFVIDVSGSMADENKLPMIRETLPYLVEEMRSDDKIGIAIYSDRAESVLKPTGLEDKSAILDAIKGLGNGGVTNAEDGLKVGYSMALESKTPGQTTRLMLLSDGVANTGESSVDGLVKMIQGYRDKGIYLSTYGFGMGEYNDELMEQLADNGDGKYAYIDSLQEAKREFIKELTGNIQTIAKDLKIQVAFQPDIVEEYRLLGYTNRLMDAKEYYNYSKDAGDIGSGHTVTALYEIKLRATENPGVIAKIGMRYKEPSTGTPKEITTLVVSNTVKTTMGQTTPGYRFALAVAEFAERLQGSPHSKSTIDGIISVAQGAVDEYSYKDPGEKEFIELLKKAKTLDG